MAIVKMGIQDDASEINYDNTKSIFSGNNVQDVLDEISNNGVYLKQGWASQSILIEQISPKFNNVKNSPAYFEIDSNNNFFCYHYSDNINQTVQVNTQINYDILENSLIYPVLHWEPDSKSIGKVRWKFNWTIARGYGVGDIIANPKNSGTFYIEQNANGNINEHMTAIATTSIPYAPPGSLLMIEIIRDAEHINDTFIGTVGAIMLSLHYQSNGNIKKNRFPFSE